MAPATLLRFARFYNSNFDRRPIPTLIITNGILNSIADGFAQATSSMMDGVPFSTFLSRYDVERTLRFGIYGMAVGPIIGKWMRLLETRIPLKAGAPNATVQLVKRVLADQLVMAPFGTALFCGAMGFMEGKNLGQIGTKYSDIYFPALFANWKVWPLIQAVNFKLMPLQYRVPFQSTCGIAWTVYLSLLNAGGDAKEASATSTSP